MSLVEVASMIFVEIDFETRSLANLKECGADRYSEDETTDVLCLCYEYDGYQGVWVPEYGCKHGMLLWGLIQDPEVTFVAHNAAFEQAIWRNIMVSVYGFPPIPIERWACTLAACAHKGYPLALDKAARALRLNNEKDKEGNKLTLSMSKLTKAGNVPELTPEIRDRIIQYCQQDVVVEQGIKARIGLLPPAERKIWRLDQIINQRGVRLDMEFVKAAQTVVALASAPLREEFTALTGLTKAGSPRLLEWCASNGVTLENLQKGTLAKVLEIEDEEIDPSYGYESQADEEGGGEVFGEGEGGSSGGDSGCETDPVFGCDTLAEPDLADVAAVLPARLPGDVRRVLEIRKMLAGAAVKKLKRMQECVGYDGRARGLLQYHAAHSGRWGGRLLQPQNFPRESVKGMDPDAVVDAILSGDPDVVSRRTGLPALEAVARSLRHALIPDPRKVFLVGDYKSIEAVIILAIAGHYDLAEQLAGGLPVYMRMAEQIYGVPPGTFNKEDNVQEYTIGKNTILGCGFQMGAAKFHSRYCSDQPLSFAERVVEAYRKDFAPRVPYVWYGLQEAALEAVKTGKPHEAYGVTYRPQPGWMVAELPNGWQKLWYPLPRLSVGKFGGAAWQYMRPKNNGMVPTDMYGGILAENVVQALARGQLCGAIERLENAGFPVVLTSHDEVVCEVPVDNAEEALVQFTALMEETSQWVKDLRIPVKVEATLMSRYRK